MLNKKNILLTGAGFTHNFGAPLANKLWGIIMSYPEVQMTPKVREALLSKSDFNFESVYHSIISGSYLDNEKNVITKAIEYAYRYIDNIVKSWTFKPGAPYPVNIYKVQKMIAAFAGTHENPGYFFTLNQDLFIERHYYNGERPRLPGIKHDPRWFKSDFREEIQDQDYIQLPKSIEDEDTLLNNSKFFYLKLHGSCNWKSRVQPQQMVIGQGKEGQIQQEPLLSLYFNIFKKILSQPNSRLLIIGYGFGDKHINEIIAQAVEENNLRVFIMTPESPKYLHDQIKKEYKKIWDGLGGYYQWTLEKMFPADQSKTTEWKIVEECFFKSA